MQSAVSMANTSRRDSVAQSLCHHKRARLTSLHHLRQYLYFTCNCHSDVKVTHTKYWTQSETELQETICINYFLFFNLKGNLSTQRSNQTSG